MSQLENHDSIRPQHTSSNTVSRKKYPPRELKADLHAWQLFMIAFSGTVGTGIFTNSGEILRMAGPGGALIAVVIVGMAAIASMDGLAEMIGLWPIANAKVEFVKAFVDEDLGDVVGIAYWYTYAMGFASVMTTTLALSEYWAPSKAIQIIFILIGCPVMLLGINLCKVKVFGMVEVVGGVLKVLIVSGVFLLLICINVGAGTGRYIGSKYINDGVQMDSTVAYSKGAAVCAAIPIVAYAFVGVEIIAVAAVEAKRDSELRMPANYIALVIASIYVLLVLMFACNVSWQDPHLPVFFGLSSQKNVRNDPPRISSVLVLAVMDSNIRVLPDFLVAALIFGALSTANTALYVASRQLFGLGQHFAWEPNPWVLRRLRYLGATNGNNVPALALLMSVLVFGSWIPALHFAPQHVKIDDLQEILSTVGTSGCVLVWACQCLAFIRYRKWEVRRNEVDIPYLKHANSRGYRCEKHKGKLVEHSVKYNQWPRDHGSDKYRSCISTLGFQPLAAWFGMITCFLIVFFLNTGSWWGRRVTPRQIFATYTGPISMLLVWGVLKIRYRRWEEQRVGPWGFVKLSAEWTDLQDKLDGLEGKINEGRVIEDSPTVEDLELDDRNTLQAANGVDAAAATEMNGEARNHGDSDVRSAAPSICPIKKPKRWRMEWNCSFSFGRA